MSIRVSPRVKKDFADLVSELKKGLKNCNKEEVYYEVDPECDITAPVVGSPEYNAMTKNFSILLRGPNGTAYQGGLFKVKLTLPDNYPFKAPATEILTKIYHPNIRDTHICLDILNDRWSPVQNLHNLFLSLCSLLASPNEKDPLNPDAGNLLKHDISNKTNNFTKQAIEWTKKHAIVDPHSKYMTVE
jgi:ubiquitin-protein ligase